MRDNEGTNATLPNESRLLWEEMEPRLAVYLRSFAGLSAEDIEEVLQGTLIALWSNRVEADTARSWLYRIARNAAIDIQRSGRRWKLAQAAAGGNAAELIDNVAAEYPTPEEDLIEAEESKLVRTFLSGLSDQDREILHLAYAEDLSYPQISQLIERPIGTIKWRIAILKRRLAKHYRRTFV